MKKAGLLILLFLVSIVIRIPNLNRPLSKHHEFVTAISLRVLHIWEEEGASTYHFNPVMNYAGEENKFIDNHATSLGKVKDQEGNFYYISHPPLAYIVPHAIFQLTGMKASVLNLQSVHLLMNFLSALCVFFIAKLLEISGLNQVLTYSLYLFSTAVLWFQSNTYMSDMLVHLFFLIGILMLLKIRSEGMNTIRGGILFLTVFCMVYTSWLGLFFVGASIASEFFYFRKSNDHRWEIVLISCLGGVVGICLMCYQYSLIAGFDVFFEQLMQRFKVRGSGANSPDGFVLNKLKELGTILFNYGVNYFPFIIVLIPLLIIQGSEKVKTTLRNNSYFLMVSLGSIALLHLTLLNYSGHDFTVLYASPFFAVFTVRMLSNIEPKKSMIISAVICCFSIGVYFITNLPGDTSIKGDRYDTSMILGNTIRKEAPTNKKVVLVTDYLDPMVVVYAKRNIIEVRTIEDSTQFPKDSHIVFVE